MHYMNADEAYGEKDRRQLHKDDANYIEQVL